jgi:uncharacterized membrane protein YvbJ
MVQSIIKNLHWIVIFILLILCVIFYEIAANKDKVLEEIQKYEQLKSAADSIKMRRLLRQKEDEAFQYRDSLRQAKINYILLKNEKSRKKTGDLIKLIPNSSTEFRDSLWTEEWSRKDSLPY